MEWPNNLKEVTAPLVLQLLLCVLYSFAIAFNDRDAPEAPENKGSYSRAMPFSRRQPWRKTPPVPTWSLQEPLMPRCLDKCKSLPVTSGPMFRVEMIKKINHILFNFLTLSSLIFFINYNNTWDLYTNTLQALSPHIPDNHPLRWIWWCPYYRYEDWGWDGAIYLRPPGGSGQKWDLNQGGLNFHLNLLVTMENSLIVLCVNWGGEEK